MVAINFETEDSFFLIISDMIDINITFVFFP